MDTKLQLLFMIYLTPSSAPTVTTACGKCLLPIYSALERCNQNGAAECLKCVNDYLAAFRYDMCKGCVYWTLSKLGMDSSSYICGCPSTTNFYVQNDRCKEECTIVEEDGTQCLNCLQQSVPNACIKVNFN